MHAHTLRRRVVAASAGLAVAATPLVAATAAQAAPSREATTSVDTTYLADTLGLPTDTVVETVTYDRFQWLLRQSGQFAFVIGTASDAGFPAKVQAADLAAKAAGATKIYWFDPNLSGFTGVRNLDTRNPDGINLAAGSQTIYGNVWKNVLGQSLGNGIKSVSNSAGNSVTITADDTVINDSVDPAWDYRSTATAAVTSTDDVFFVYDKDRTVEGGADKIADWVNLSTTTTAPAELAAAFAAIGGGSVIDQTGEFKWWQSENNRIQTLQNGGTPEGIARYGGDILKDSDAANGWNVEQLTYPELLHVLNLKQAGANFALLFGGTWCPNTRAVVKFVNDEAVDNNVKVYNFDLVLDGGKVNGTNQGTNPIHVRDNANSGSTFNFRPSWVYGDVARGYFKNLVTEYDPQGGNRVAFYPAGDLNAFPDVARKLQVPFLIGYERGTGTNPANAAVKRQWIQQNTDANTGLPTFKEYMSNWWFTNPSAQLGLSFAIPADLSTLTEAQSGQYNGAIASRNFGQEAVAKLGTFFKGLPGAVVSTQTVTAPSVPYGEASTVTLAISDTYGRVPSGSATLTVNGASYSQVVAANAAVFTTAALPVGTYPYTITYAGDAQIKAFSKTGSLEVTKTQVESVAGVATEVPTASSTGDFHVTVTEPSGLAKANGNVAVTFTKGASSVVANGALINGAADVTIPILPSGTWTTSVEYSGNGNYYGTTVAGGSFTVSEVDGPVKADVTIESEVTTAPTTLFSGVYDVAIETGVGQPTATGDVTLTLTKGASTRTVAEELVDGEAHLSIPALSEGTWTARVLYSGDDVYAAKTRAGASVTAVKNSVTVGTTVVAPTPQKAGSYTVSVDTPGLAKASGAVTVTLTKGAATQSLTGTLAAGKVTVAVPKLAAGTWTASVAYDGDATFAAATAAGKSVVSSKTAVSKVAGAVTKTPTTKKTGTYKVTVSAPSGLAKATGKVTVTLKKGSSKKTVTGTLKSGVVSITVPKLAKGTWKATVAYPGDANYTAKTATGASIKVTK